MNTLKVDFYLVDAFEILHFLPIYRMFKRHDADVAFIAEPTDENAAGSWFDYDTAISMLDEKQVDYLTEFRRDADLAFTTQYSKDLFKYDHAIKIHMPYGMGLLKSVFMNSAGVLEGFDYSLAHGSYHQALLEKHNILGRERLPIIGYPRYTLDDRKRKDKNECRKELGIETDKPVIVYLPTWDEDNSITLFRNDFEELGKKSYIVTKPHHCTARFLDCAGDLMILNQISDLVVGGNDDLATIVGSGDILICDAKSGVSLEAAFLYPDTPMILLSVRSEPELFFLEETFNIAAFCNKESALPGVVDRILRDDPYCDYRKQFIHSVYSSDAGEGILYEMFKNMTFEDEFRLRKEKTSKYSKGKYERQFVDIFDNVNDGKLILFGAGKYARKFMERYGNDYAVDVIVDNNENRWREKLFFGDENSSLGEGIEIVSPGYLAVNKQEKYKVIICVADYWPVMAQLDKMGITEYSVFNPSREYKCL